MDKKFSLVLLDFDGPLCDLFVGYPAQTIAEKVARLAQDISKLPLSRFADPDPMQVLIKASLSGVDEATLVTIDEVLRDAEIAATDSAVATSGACDLVLWLASEHVPWGVVTNNSSEAVARFFSKQGWPTPKVSGRDAGRPMLMKPNAAPLNRLIMDLGHSTSRTCFLGDSVADVEAAIACGATPIGFANKVGKSQRLRAAGATRLFDDLSEFLAWLKEHTSRA